jgi:hypothetical protein
MAQVNATPSEGQLMAGGVVKSEADWQTHLKTWPAHPLTVERLSALALDGRARRAGSGDQRDALAFIASKLAYMMGELGDPVLQGCMTVRAHRADPATLAPRRVGAGSTVASCKPLVRKGDNW